MESKSAIYHIRFIICSLITLGLTAVCLWGLASFYDPTANLTKIHLWPVNENYSTMYLEMEIINRNYFRGFNYTDEGWVEIFSVTNGSRWGMTWAYIPNQYQGFGDTLRWNFAVNITDGKLNWKTNDDIPMLKNHETHIYMSFYLTYVTKILLWVTKTPCYQWLDTSVYLDKNLDFNGVSNFTRIKDFTGVVN